MIALSGVLEIDPARPLAFALVTNGDAPLSKAYVRKAHEQLVALLCKYLAKTTKQSDSSNVTPPAAPATEAAHPAVPDDLEEAAPDPELDSETAGKK